MLTASVLAVSTISARCRGVEKLAPRFNVRALASLAAHRRSRRRMATLTASVLAVSTVSARCRGVEKLASRFNVRALASLAAHRRSRRRMATLTASVLAVSTVSARCRGVEKLASRFNVRALASLAAQPRALLVVAIMAVVITTFLGVHANWALMYQAAVLHHAASSRSTGTSRYRVQTSTAVTNFCALSTPWTWPGSVLVVSQSTIKYRTFLVDSAHRMIMQQNAVGAPTESLWALFRMH